MLLKRQLRQSDIMFLLTSQFIKLLVMQIKNPGPFVICVLDLYTDAICIILHVPVHKRNSYIYLL